MSLHSRSRTLLGALAVAVCGFPLAAQVCGPPVASFVFEHPVDITGIKSTLTPHLDPAALAGVFAGTQEIRSRVTYQAGAGLFFNDLFLVKKGAPNPTPPNTDFRGIRFGFLVVSVDQTYTTCKPFPTFMLVGTIQDGAPIFVPPAGAPYIFSFVYNVPNPSGNPFAPGTTVRDVVSDSVGLGLLYHPVINAIVTFADATGLKGAPAIRINIPSINGAPGTTAVAVTDSPFQVDATGTTDPNGGILSFQWASDKPAAFWPSSTGPAPRITFQNGAGTYKITLLVTSSSGLTSTSSFTLNYAGPKS